MRTERSAMYGKVSRQRVGCVDRTGTERAKSFQYKPDGRHTLNGLTAASMSIWARARRYSAEHQQAAETA